MMAHRLMIRSFATMGKPLYSAKVTVVGARKGNAKGESLNLGLTMSKALGGDGEPNKSNPEELFAAGFGACFQSAMNAVAVSQGVKLPNESTVTSTVHLLGDLKKLDLSLGVDLEIKVPQGIERSKMQQIVDQAEKACPYSRAVRGNIPVNIKVV